MNRHPYGKASLRRVLSMASVAALLALSPAAANAAGESAGATAYLRGDFDTAYREFQRSAETGDAVSQFNLGGMFFEGRGVERNTREAAYWFRKSAEQGVALAQHGLAVLYYRGAGVSRDYAEAARWFAKAADQGVPNAQFNLGVLYYRGEGVQRDIGQMLSWIRKSADQGFMPAAYQLGVIYENGVGVTPDPALALKWYQRAAAGDHPRARERVKAIIARTGLANIEDLPPMRAAGRDDGRRNDALGGIPTFIRTASDTGNAAPRPDKPAVTMTDALPSPPPPATQSAAVAKPEAPRTAARPAEPAPAARPAATLAAKPAEPPPAPKPAEPAPAPAAAAKPPVPAAAAKPPAVAAAADAKATPAPPAEAAAKPEPPPVAVASRSPEPRPSSRVYMVQLGSQPSEALAQQTWSALSKSFPDALAGHAPVFKSVQLAGRGNFTRVYVGPFDQRDQAKAICASIAARDSKQGCLVLSVTP